MNQDSCQYTWQIFFCWPSLYTMHHSQTCHWMSSVGQGQQLVLQSFITKNVISIPQFTLASWPNPSIPLIPLPTHLYPFLWPVFLNIFTSSVTNQRIFNLLWAFHLILLQTCCIKVAQSKQMKQKWWMDVIDIQLWLLWPIRSQSNNDFHFTYHKIYNILWFCNERTNSRIHNGEC